MHSITLPSPLRPLSISLPDFSSAPWIRTLEKVSAVGLGVFSLLASPTLFLPFFAGGAILGFCQTPEQSHPAECEHGRGPSCSGGFLEQITHVKSPALVALVANVAVTYCHIEHHTRVFVPIVAVTLGMAAGQMLRKTSISVS